MISLLSANHPYKTPKRWSVASYSWKFEFVKNRIWLLEGHSKGKSAKNILSVCKAISKITTQLSKSRKITKIMDSIL